MTQSRKLAKTRVGFSLIEMILAVVVIAVVTTYLLRNVGLTNGRVGNQSCVSERMNLQTDISLYRRTTGTLPSMDLREIASQRTIPVCPVDGRPYILNRSTGLVEVHSH